jgi:hypothetical protein
MATVPAYTRALHDMELADLLTRAELVREMTETFGWRYLTEAIDQHEQKMLARLLNESTHPEEIPRLRGLLSGLRSAREAAESIISYAAEAEEKARQRTKEHA